MAKWFLIDGFNLAFRSFYAIPELTRPDGFPTNAIHGWIYALWRLQDTYKPDNIVIFYDCGGSARRKAIQPLYKANRHKMPELLEHQLPVIKELSLAMGFGAMEKEGVEADDLIGNYAYQIAQQGETAYMVSADKDLAQNIGQGIFQLLPPSTTNRKSGWRILDEAGVKRTFGIKPAQIPEYLAIIGDISDNIAGIQGVGPKTASKWLNQYGTLENIITNCGCLKPTRFQSIIHQNADKLRTNLQITTLEKSNDDFISVDIPKIDTPKIFKILLELDMKKAYNTVLKR
jgi:DNA polymerase I